MMNCSPCKDLKQFQVVQHLIPSGPQHSSWRIVTLNQLLILVALVRMTLERFLKIKLLQQASRDIFIMMPQLPLVHVLSSLEKKTDHSVQISQLVSNTHSLIYKKTNKCLIGQEFYILPHSSLLAISMLCCMWLSMLLKTISHLLITYQLFSWYSSTLNRWIPHYNMLILYLVMRMRLRLMLMLIK